jgi:hypothetical protein
MQFLVFLMQVRGARGLCHTLMTRHSHHHLAGLAGLDYIL